MARCLAIPGRLREGENDVRVTAQVGVLTSAGSGGSY